MKNWLSTIRQSVDGGIVKATEAQHLQVIEAGFSHYLHRARNPQAGGIFTQPPLQGVAVVRNEKMLTMFFSMCVSEGAEMGRWGGHRWYYPCWSVPTIMQTESWVAIERATRPHNVIPRLGHTADIWHFENADWTLCELYLCLR